MACGLDLHRLWWQRLARWFCTVAGMSETINEKNMEAADKTKYILGFYFRVCMAIITYLNKVFLSTTQATSVCATREMNANARYL